MRQISRTAAALAASVLLTMGTVLPAMAGTIKIDGGKSVDLAGPVETTATSHPFGAVANIDLPERGYVEEEYFLSGKANVYSWNDAASGVKAESANTPYTTRIVVIKPADPKKFNGRVMVDIVNMTNGWDFNKMWAVMHEHLLENGWAYVGITSKPNAAKALKVFDPERYKSLSWSNPVALDNPKNCEKVPADSDRSTENGLVWDIFTDTGKMLRAGGPLVGYDVKNVFLTGFSQSGRFLYTYVNGFQMRDRLDNGKSVYDGFLLGGAPIQSAAQAINQCSDMIAAPDPRAFFMQHDAPVIDVVGAMDVLGLINTYPMRQDDSDDPKSPYRLWEVAGAAHSWLYQNGFNVTAADVAKAGFDNFADRVPPICAALGHPNDTRMHFALDAALDALDHWVDDGVPAPKVPRLEIAEKGGKPQFVLDQDGNQLGGYRLPELRVPTATYVAGLGEGWQTRQGCWSWSHRIPFSKERIDALYSSQGDYVARMFAATQAMLKDRLLTAGDARRAMTAAANVVIP